jgi:hypothetical protein
MNKKQEGVEETKGKKASVDGVVGAPKKTTDNKEKDKDVANVEKKTKKMVKDKEVEDDVTPKIDNTKTGHEDHGTTPGSESYLDISADDDLDFGLKDSTGDPNATEEAQSPALKKPSVHVGNAGTRR